MKTMTKKQLNFDQAARKALERIAERMGCSLSNAAREAVRYFDQLQRHAEDGYRDMRAFKPKNGKGEYVLSLPPVLED